jgi:hypothetical protein
MILPLLSGCSSAVSTPRDDVLRLEEYWIGCQAMSAGGVMCVAPQFAPGVDPKAFLEKAVWYLRHRPDAVIGGNDEVHATNPWEPRSRDVLAALVARQKGIYFYCLRKETDAELDQKIQALVRLIDEMEAGKQGGAASQGTSQTSPHPSVGGGTSDD